MSVTAYQILQDKSGEKWHIEEYFFWSIFKIEWWKLREVFWE